MAWLNVPASRPDWAECESVAYYGSLIAQTGLQRMISDGNWSPVCRVLYFAGLAAILLFFASCIDWKVNKVDELDAGFLKLRSVARSVVTDPARLDTYLDYSLSLESELQSFRGGATDFVDRFRGAFTNYDAEQDRLRKLTAEFRERQQQAQDRFVELHLAMAHTVTPEEWESLSKQERELFTQLFNLATGSR